MNLKMNKPQLIYIHDKYTISLLFSPFLFCPLLVYLLQKLLAKAAQFRYNQMEALQIWLPDPIYWVFPAMLFGLAITMSIWGKLGQLVVQVWGVESPPQPKHYSIWRPSSLEGGKGVNKVLELFFIAVGIILILAGVDKYTRFTQSTIYVNHWLNIGEQQYEYSQVTKLEHIVSEGGGDYYVIQLADGNQATTENTDNEALRKTYDLAVQYVATKTNLPIELVERK